MQKRFNIISRLIIIVIILFSQNLFVFGQEKYEKEIRIKESKVPENALKTIKKLTNSKVKWYQEFNAENIITYEAKFKNNKKHISVEFTENGELLDVEIKIKKNEIPDNLLNIICSEIESKYKKYKFLKIQKQLLGNAENIHMALNNNVLKNVSVNYEIVLLVKSQYKYESRELLFNNKGILISDKKIINKNTTNLEF